MPLWVGVGDYSGYEICVDENKWVFSEMSINWFFSTYTNSIIPVSCPSYTRFQLYSVPRKQLIQNYDFNICSTATRQFRANIEGCHIFKYSFIYRETRDEIFSPLQIRIWNKWQTFTITNGFEGEKSSTRLLNFSQFQIISTLKQYFKNSHNNRQTFHCFRSFVLLILRRKRCSMATIKLSRPKILITTKFKIL